MNIEFRNITNKFFNMDNVHQRNLLCAVISAIAISVFYLLNRMRFSSGSFSRIDFFTKKNLEAIKQKWYLTRLLFRGSLEKQEVIAKKMATDMGIPFHCFDGRKLNQDMQKFNELLKSVSSSSTPVFIFVSHADEICRTGGSVLNTILVHTGSVSQKLLLCLGVSSNETLPPALATRYREQLIIGE